MGDRFENLLAEFDARPPAGEIDIAGAEEALGNTFPADYKAFLADRDGGEGFIGKHYLILWRAAELKQLNDAYEVETYAPGLIMFGSSGGGDGFAFDTRQTPFPIIQVPFIGMILADGFCVADCFAELLDRMSTTDGSLF